MRVVRPAAALGVALLALACGAGAPTAPDGRGSAGAGGPPLVGADQRLVGRWSRILYFTGDDGSAHSSETVWDFAADRSFLRRVVARNHTAGLVDTVWSAGTWRTEAPDALVLRWTEPPSAVDVRFPWRVEGDTLLALDETTFRRVAR